MFFQGLAVDLGDGSFLRAGSRPRRVLGESMVVTMFFLVIFYLNGMTIYFKARTIKTQFCMFFV